MTVQPHTRVTFSGIFGATTAPVEEWMFNLSAGTFPNRSTTDLEAAAAACGTAWTTHLASLYWPSTVLQRVRVADLNADGHVLRRTSGAFIQGDHVQNRPGTATGGTENRFPLSTALCVSLGTALPGQAGKGRFYLPWPSYTGIGTDYRLAASTADDIATKCKAFVNALTVALQADVSVSAASSATSGKQATLTPVDFVRIGRVPDTMRSRRSRMLEGYSVQTL